MFGREASLLGKIWNFEGNLSAKDIISRHNNNPEGVLFIYNPLINFPIANEPRDSLFCWLFCTFWNSICEQLLNVVIARLNKTSLVSFHAKYIAERKSWNSCADYVLFRGSNRRIKIDAGGSHCVITVPCEFSPHDVVGGWWRVEVINVFRKCYEHRICGKCWVFWRATFLPFKEKKKIMLLS